MRCVTCAHYPWRPDCDPSMLPPVVCHPALGLQRWTDRSASRERVCTYYEPRDQVAPEPAPIEAPEPAPKPRAGKTRRRRRK